MGKPVTTEPTAAGEAAAVTVQMNAAVLEALPFEDRRDFEDARRGLAVPASVEPITGAGPVPVWDMGAYAFEEAEEAPATVNPSLWRQARLNRIAGLFEVTDRVWQVRGLDLSNMSIVEGEDGVIVIDPLISTECSAAGLAMYREHRGDRRVTAVIYTHPHVDHYGGVKGVINQADVDAGKVRVIAPEGFLRHAVSENVFAGTAMSRRSHYQYGVFLPRNAKGQVDLGLGKAVSNGTITLIEPTETIRRTGEVLVVGGVEIEFQLTPGTEAPTEMNFYLPQMRALCMAENATHNQHNLLTLRGAEVRDPKAWAHYLDEAIRRYTDRCDVLFASHHWPTWGSEPIKRFLSDQRDMYRYLHDQTLRLLNHGYKPMEIAEILTSLPPELDRRWYNRGYYGSISHGVRAIYQRYLGFFDGNPTNLNPLPPVEASKKYVEAIGGPQAVLDKARAAFDDGEYRWAAQLADHLVFAEPDNTQARALQADILEQLGYQCENGTWRSVYLSGALDLRHGVDLTAPLSAVSPDTIRAMPPDLWFDYLGIRLNGPRAANLPVTVFNWQFTDLDEIYVLTLSNGALTCREGDRDPGAAATLTLDKAALDAISLQQVTLEQAINDGTIEVEGDTRVLLELFGMLDDFVPMFNIVTPNPPPDQRAVPSQRGPDR